MAFYVLNSKTLERSVVLLWSFILCQLSKNASIVLLKAIHCDLYCSLESKKSKLNEGGNCAEIFQIQGHH